MTPCRSPRTVLGRAAACVAAVAALLLGSASPAAAHAYLERTNPGDGSVVAQAPDRLALYFSEHVVLEATTIELVDGHGQVTRLQDLQLETDEPGDTEVPSVVTAELPALPRDAYRVRWSTLSSDDLHETSGFFVFGVGTAVRAAGFSEPSPREGESALRWLLLVGLALALGSALVGRLTPAELEAGRRARRVGTLGAATAAVVAVALVLEQVGSGGLGVDQLIRSGYAGRWGLREAGLLLVLLVLASRRPRTRPGDLLLVVGAVTAAVGTALLGHAGADPGPAYWRVGTTAVHLVAMLTWSGGVVCLATVLLPAAVRRGAGELTTRALLRRFGPPAAVCLGLGVASGLLLTSTTVVSVDAALGTIYGRTLLIKLALVGVMVALGVANHRRLRGRHDLDLPRRGVLAEATAATLVLLATAVLTSAQPATEQRFLTAPAATIGPISAGAADLHIGVDVAPNVPGVNVVSIDVFDTRRPAPGQVTRVGVSIDGTSTSATSLGSGRWTLADVDLRSGQRVLVVTVTRPGLSDTTMRVPWTVGVGAGAPRPIVSTAPVAAPLRGLATLVLTGLLLALLVRRRRDDPAARADGPADGPANGPGRVAAISSASAGPRPRSSAHPQDRSPAP